MLSQRADYGCRVSRTDLFRFASSTWETEIRLVLDDLRLYIYSKASLPDRIRMQPNLNTRSIKLEAIPADLSSMFLQYLHCTFQIPLAFRLRRTLAIDNIRLISIVYLNLVLRLVPLFIPFFP